MKKFFKHFEGNSLKSQMLKGVFGTALLRVVNMILTIILGVLLARSLGPESYGVYVFLLSLISMLALPTHAGLPSLVMRETARNQLHKKWGLVKGLLRLSGLFVWGYSLVTATIIFVLILWLWSGEQGIKSQAFLWALLLLPLIAFEKIRTATLRGMRWIVASQIPEQIISPIVAICCLSVVLLLGDGIDTVAAIKINIFSVFIAFCIGAMLLIKALPKEVRSVREEYSLKIWATSLLPLSLFAGFQILDSQLSIILLAFLSTSDEVGFFRVALTSAGLVSFGLSAVNTALAPQVSRLYLAGELEKLQKIITYSTRGTAVISFPVVVAFALWGEQIISLVFGFEYVQATSALLVLCLAQLISASTGSVALVLNMTGNERYTVKAMGCSVAVNVLLALFLIPLLGGLGAAIGYAASIVLRNLLLYRATKKYTGLNTFVF